MSEQSLVLSIGVNGRLLLPSILRNSLNLSEGDRLLVKFEEEGSCLKMAKLQDDIDRAEGLYQSFAPPFGSIVEELIAERRQQAAKE
jgi:bifunctional DNA-binding transcriptional regulator/antitoxin component of YhaV-PrlF toxin-antitoxin module